MKRLLTGCLLALSLTGWGQLQFALEDPNVSFPPTTIDSTSTLSFVIINELSLPQEVSLTGLDAPFFPESEVVSIPANDTLSAAIDFTPGEIGSFGDTLIISGNVFGMDTLIFTGEGALPIVNVGVAHVDFGIVSINNIHEQLVPITNSGSGSLFIGTPSSDSEYFYSDGNVVVGEGETIDLPIYFTAPLANPYSGLLTFPTSDPYNPSVEVSVEALAISELSGEICGNLSIINSPYQLIGNIFVPENCELTIDPGVVIQGEEYRMEVMGALHANGTEAEPILIDVEAVISHVTSDNCTFTHCNVTERQDAYTESILDEYMVQILAEAHQTDPVSYLQAINANEDDLGFYTLPFMYGYGFDDGSSTYGIPEEYIENGDDGNWQGWSGGSSGSTYNTSSGCCGSSTRDFYSPTFHLSPEFGQSLESFHFDFRVDLRYNCDYDVRLYISVDGGGWYEYWSSSCDFDWTDFTYNWSDFASTHGLSQNPESVSFRFRTYYYYQLYAMELDNFELTHTSPFPGSGYTISSQTYNDLNNYFGVQPPYTSNWDFIQQGLNTGGLELYHTNWTGDHTAWGDDIAVKLDHSVMNGADADSQSNHGIWIQGDNASLEFSNSELAGHPLDGIHIRGNNTTLDGYGWHLASNGDQGFHSTGSCAMALDSINVEFNGDDAFEMLGTSTMDVYQSRVEDNGGDAFEFDGGNSQLTMQYSFLRNNGGDGVEMASNSELDVQNSLIGYNGSNGITTGGAVNVNYANILGNGSRAIHASNFSTLDNSIVWFNGAIPQLSTNNAYAASYCNVQGLNALLTSTAFAWGDECIGTNPALQDSLGHLDPYSPCVDGGMPWEQDAHIPYGLGSSRADMGMYGGPANAYWGGQAPPDGAVVITDIFDIPDDQGGEVGLHFTASPFDFGGLGFNVTHYSIWRDLAVGSDLPTEVESGNWEQIGTVPAQGFNQYGYTAATLVDQMPDETSCLSSFLVIAHTTDDNIYWISEVASVCSIDNLAPDTPDMNGMVVEGSEGMPEAVISWAEVEVEDYFYTTVTNLATGFEATVYGDTLVVDASVEGGLTYDYAAVHVDIHGNVSDPAGLTLMVPGGEDFIPLHAGWNLVSFDRHPDVMPISELTGGLVDGNLQYITGFDGGAQFYDANGLPFLNTLTVLEGGRGYWFKVAQDDTLFVEGPRVLESDLPALVNGWNLVGYVADEDVSVEDYYSELLASEALLYVTGFTEQGVTIFNPGAPAFLNTLTGLTNSMGYWVKVDDGTAGMTTSSNPDFIVLNGSGASNHESIEIVNEAGDVVGVMHALEGGYAMTAAVYGTDPQTGQSTGVRHGEVLRFRQGDRWADETVVFDGSMKHHHVRFHFDQVNAVAQVFPNPTSDRVTFTFTGEGLLNAWDIMDASGRVVAQIAVEGHATSTTMDVSALDAGMYLATPTGDGMSHVEPVTFQVIR